MARDEKIEPGNRTRRIAVPSTSLQTSPSVSGIDATDSGLLTILVADDEPLVRVHVGRVLRRNGFHVLQAADGVEALELAAQHAGPIHLLLTDVVMPRMDGRELHRRMNHQRPHTRTLFMSGCADPGLYPGAEFLPKPFVPLELVRKVTEVLQARCRTSAT